MLTDIHRLSLGTAALAGLYRPVSHQAAEDVLSAAWDNGIRFFDTAPHYGNGAAEGLIGDLPSQPFRLGFVDKSRARVVTGCQPSARGQRLPQRVAFQAEI